MVESARELLNNYLPDVYVYTDVVKGNEAGKSLQWAMEEFLVHFS